MISFYDKEIGITYEITQQKKDRKLNIDVAGTVDDFDVDYYFEIPADELLNFLLNYQRENNII